MIRITCTHCRQVLTIDEGFAGGVCRCQSCGTIQTVPASKTTGRGAAAKTLYRTADHTGPSVRHDNHLLHDHPLSDSTLEDLAEIVSSSGLRSNSRRLRQPLPIGMAAKTVYVPPRRRKHTLTLIIGGVVILLLLGIIAMLTEQKWHASPSAAAPPHSAAASTLPPSFAAMPIQAEDTVIYLIDDGGSAGDILPAMQAACFQSIKTLGPARRFKVMFWRDDSPSFPADGTARATPDEEANCEAALRDAYAQGSTSVDAALKSAIAARPDAIILVTAKAAQLPDDFAQTVQSIRGDVRTRIYTIGINGDSTTDPAQTGLLAAVASHSGGQFLNISSSDLDRLVH